jgi:hypothetical protein
MKIAPLQGFSGGPKGPAQRSLLTKRGEQQLAARSSSGEEAPFKKVCN